MGSRSTLSISTSAGYGAGYPGSRIGRPRLGRPIFASSMCSASGRSKLWRWRLSVRPSGSSSPRCILAAQNITPSPLLYTPARWLLNILRGIDSFIFALLFVAAVGLGPFAGVLGVGLHSAGSIAKLWSEAIEAVEPGPLEAVALTGANRLKVISYALLPDILPNLTSIALYVWEFNVRSSTVLGVVGAGGIGQELKNSVDLLDFSRLLTIILILLAMVTVIDQFSAWLRRRLV